MQVLRAVGAMLTYPDAQLVAALPEIAAMVRGSSVFAARERVALAAFAESLAARDPYAAQEDYVACFDRGRATALHLFEHVHGESRERGQALIDLRDQYLKAGLAMNASELPDYLPAFLEYLSVLAPRAARDQLGEIVHILHGIHDALLRRGSPYADLLASLIVLTGEKPRAVEVAAMADEPALDLEGLADQAALDALDAQWAEPPAFGAMKPGSCGNTGAASSVPIHFHPKSASPKAQAPQGALP